MTQALERPTEQESELDNVEDHFFDLARCLVQYHRHSLEVRSQGFIDSLSFDPPEVRELTNFLLWRGDGFNVVDAGEHMLSLIGIIRRSSDTVHELIENVRTYGATEQLAYEVNYVNAQLAAADTLLRMIDHD